MTHARIYPGMACESVEFFNHRDEIKVIQNGNVKDFKELSGMTVQILREEISKNKLVENELLELHPDSEFKRLEKFVKCRFGGLDFEGDIKGGVLQQGEYWECPLRGNCKSEGTLCMLPVYNGERLTSQEVKLIQLTATTKTNEVIADELQLPLGTLHKSKKFLYEKLGVQTKQEIAGIGFLLNLIQF